MTIRAEVSTVEVSGEIVQLTLRTSGKLVDLQAAICGSIPGQTRMGYLHVTLCSAPETAICLPDSPDFVEFDPVPELVGREDKTSTYLRVTQATQTKLAEYVERLAASRNGEIQYDVARVFHASLTNLTGQPRGSIAKIWEYEPFKLVGIAWAMDNAGRRMKMR